MLYYAITWDVHGIFCQDTGITLDDGAIRLDVLLGSYVGGLALQSLCFKWTQFQLFYLSNGFCMWETCWIL
jgi:hypothetical protein